MKHTIGTRSRDAEDAVREAQRDGQRAGEKEFPKVDGSGDKVSDYHEGRRITESETTAALTTAGHFAGPRVQDDQVLAKARADTAQHITRSKDARQTHEDDLAEHRAYRQSMPLSAQAGFWPRWLVGFILVVVAAASGAAAVAALQSVTSDSTTLAYIVGLGIALAAVAGGASLGALLRRQDLDRIEKGEYATTSARSYIVIAVAVVGLFGIAMGVALLRQAASTADAQRRAAQTSAITVTVPGQTAAAPTVTPVHPSGVPWYVWLGFEMGLLGVACGVEYQRSDVRAEHGEKLSGQAEGSKLVWIQQHQALAGAVSGLESAAMTRADHDAATALTGQAGRQFAATLTNAYREADLIRRTMGGDPFEQVATGSPSALHDQFTRSPGADVATLGSVAPTVAPASDPAEEAADPDAPEQVAATTAVLPNGAVAEHHLIDWTLLSEAYAELSRTPERPKRQESEVWTPGAYLALDGSAKALREAQDSAKTSAPAEPDDKTTNRHQPETVDVDAELVTRPLDAARNGHGVSA